MPRRTNARAAPRITRREEIATPYYGHFAYVLWHRRITTTSGRILNARICDGEPGIVLSGGGETELWLILDQREPLDLAETLDQAIVEADRVLDPQADQVVELMSPTPDYNPWDDIQPMITVGGNRRAPICLDFKPYIEPVRLSIDDARALANTLYLAHAVHHEREYLRDQAPRKRDS